MIRLPSVELDNQHLDKLQEYTGKVEAKTSFEERSAEAKKLFSAYNKRGNATFDAVKHSLTEMCAGARRCVYCEDSVADEVEHIYPKDLYPEKCFRWDNYVYACGTCNGPKNNKFAVFKKDDGNFTNVNPQRGQPALGPVAGDAVLINPRTEDALDYCILDLKGTFKFVILAKPGTKSYQRADYTFNEVLRLNDQREYLRKARQAAYGNYKARLYQYANEKARGATKEKLEKMIEGIKTEAHPTVWKEMQRWHKRKILPQADADLDRCFVDVPEALSW